MLEGVPFSMLSDSGHIVSIPLMLESFTPNLDSTCPLRCSIAPMHMKIGRSHWLQVDWDREEKCFDSISRECSRFYSIDHDPFLVDSERSAKDIDCSSCATSEQATTSQVGI